MWRSEFGSPSRAILPSWSYRSSVALGRVQLDRTFVDIADVYALRRCAAEQLIVTVRAEGPSIAEARASRWSGPTRILGEGYGAERGFLPRAQVE